MIWATSQIIEMFPPSVSGKVKVLPDTLKFGGNIVVTTSNLPVITKQSLLAMLDNGLATTMLFPNDTLALDVRELTDFFQESVYTAQEFGIPRSQFVFITLFDNRLVTLDRQLVSVFTGCPSIAVTNFTDLLVLCSRVENMMTDGNMRTQGDAVFTGDVILGSRSFQSSSINRQISDALVEVVEVQTEEVH